ncbi:RagB/SusD family nutrient uptake outer membrane protein [Sediminibacterium roseum]|uniref:RagB/SusD family nutrient uptake outer membrane protein n=2 Tax=Sediminibacterium roseum TaxID=1978412 RepID=A0ABW9ZNY6_9BACT|nr:RagB/SusD family nutrient uptake outer membrane protein [Sediminibacterium roseum]
MIAAGLFLGGCTKSFVEQSNPNAVPVDNGYKTETDITTGVYGVYQALRSSNCVGEGAQLWTDDRADDVNTTDNQSNNGEPFQFTAFSLVPSNSYLQSHWSALYTPITRANLVLSVIGDIPFASESTRTQYIAELKFIRAYMYYQLVREFGDVPLVTERLTSAEQASALTFRAKREDVYAQIVKDLKDVLASNLPVTQSAANKGRVSMQAANATLGQVYLTMATSLSATPSTEYLNNAKTYLLACYAQKGFTNLSDVPFTDVFDVNKKATCPEIIWQIAYKQGDPSYSSSLARSNQAKNDGTFISQFPSQGAGGLFTKDLLNEFETGDLRTNYSIRFVAANNGYYISKFRDNSTTAGTLGYGGNDWILIRYADVILNLAEVYLYLGDNATAIQYLDMVRARASRPGYAAMQGDASYTSKYPSLKLAILHERRIELAFEHHRWHDLTRFFKPDELVNYFKTKSQANFDNSPITNMTAKDYYFPIPYNEYKLDPVKMYQNPGY